ncbi:hypothetical protein HELRODRAFT_179894 [Helobdella robusta]|uniref:Uncharacterized protein n=1 Tax=Helobdella robusta TaxID=6412 RepID=T1FF84_HELRO|nr:hypothetical protein HELRODRAFT_179894 [Helobdella robusta]ESN95035.1 hypothetical protein HELRODRAFT_179894 [Helobdella robusta]
MARIPVTEEPVDLKAVGNRIMKRVLFTIFISGVITYLYYHYAPIKTRNFDSVGDKIAYVIQCNLLSVCFIMRVVHKIGDTRRKSNQVNPLSSKDLHKIDVAVRVLQNTLEQFVINIFLQLISVTWFGSDEMKLIPICAFWFLLGRILFWIGYNDPSDSRTKRAYGFALTFFPSVVLAMFCIFMFFWDIYLAYF